MSLLIKKPSVIVAQQSHVSPSNSPAILGSGHISTTLSSIRASRPRYPSIWSHPCQSASPGAPRR